MAEERPYSLLIRLGAILAPLLAAVLLWSYYHPISAARNPPPVMPAPVAASGPKAVDWAVAAPGPAANAAAATTATMPPSPALSFTADPAAWRSVATDNQRGAAQGAVASPSAAMPPIPGPPPQTTPSAEPRRAREIRKQEAASAHRTIQKLDSQIDRKLSICSGC